MNKQRCLCNLCTAISPMQKRIFEALPEDLKPDFEYLMMKMACAETDLEVAESKLHGMWPGWEWMKESVKEQEYKPAA